MDWLNKAWRFLKNETNQKTLAFVGGGIATVAIAGWQFYTHFAPSGPSEQPAPAVTASGGGVASGGDITITQSSPGTMSAVCTVFHRRTINGSRRNWGSRKPR